MSNERTRETASEIPGCYVVGSLFFLTPGPWRLTPDYVIDVILRQTFLLQTLIVIEAFAECGTFVFREIPWLAACDSGSFHDELRMILQHGFGHENAAHIGKNASQG